MLGDSSSLRLLAKDRENTCVTARLTDPPDASMTRLWDLYPLRPQTDRSVPTGARVLSRSVLARGARSQGLRRRNLSQSHCQGGRHKLHELVPRSPPRGRLEGRCSALWASFETRRAWRRSSGRGPWQLRHKVLCDVSVRLAARSGFGDGAQRPGSARRLN
jgi:hypothetical protein